MFILQAEIAHFADSFPLGGIICSRTRPAGKCDNVRIAIYPGHRANGTVTRYDERYDDCIVNNINNCRCVLTVRKKLGITTAVRRCLRLHPGSDK